jgi:hypothetical protein
MRIEAVHRQAEQRAIQRVEFVGDTCQRDELACANRGEVGWMRKEYQPAAAILIEADLALCGSRPEDRRFFADSERPGGRFVGHFIHPGHHIHNYTIVQLTNLKINYINSVVIYL